MRMGTELKRISRQVGGGKSLQFPGRGRKLIARIIGGVVRRQEPGLPGVLGRGHDEEDVALFHLIEEGHATGHAFGFLVQAVGLVAGVAHVMRFLHQLAQG